MAKLLGEDLRRAKLAAISPLTADVLRELGYDPAVVARDYTAPGLIDAMVAASST